MRRRVLLFLLLTLVITTQTGCGAQGKLYGQSKVLEYMENAVPQEEYTFESMEKVDDTDVPMEIYHFRSKERDLEFVAKNTRTSIFDNAAVYRKTIVSEYVEGVHELYRDDAESILDDSGLTIDDDKIYIESYDDLVDLADYFVDADDLYKNELDYNSEEWLIENPLEKYSLYKLKQNNKSKAGKVYFGSIAVNGTWDKENLLDYVSFCYASAIKEEKIEDETLPDQYIDQAHISTLHNIYLNEENISEAAHSTAKKKNLNNNSQENYYSGYSYKLGDYIVPLNVGVTDENYAPQIMEEIFENLDIDYDIEYGNGVVSWEDDGDKWKIEASETDNEIQSVIIKKNGKTKDIPYILCGEWTSPVNCTYIVGIRATDFADIFDLEMQVDELDDSISFEK